MTQTITDVDKVNTGDEAWFRDSESNLLGPFPVMAITDRIYKRLRVLIPFSETHVWALNTAFDHAERPEPTPTTDEVRKAWDLYAQSMDLPNGGFYKWLENHDKLVASEA